MTPDDIHDLKERLAHAERLQRVIVSLRKKQEVVKPGTINTDVAALVIPLTEAADGIYWLRLNKDFNQDKLSPQRLCDESTIAPYLKEYEARMRLAAGHLVAELLARVEKELADL